jgi:hypothetical protein
MELIIYWFLFCYTLNIFKHNLCRRCQFDVVVHTSKKKGALIRALVNN